MAWTKMNFYLGIITIAVIFWVGFSIVGDDANNNLVLDGKSVDYVAQLKGIAEEENFNGIAESNKYDTEIQDPLRSSENSSVSTDSDFLSTLRIKQERASQPTRYFKLVYNIPTTILKGLGLPLKDFNYITNTIIFALLIGIIIMIWRFIRP